MSALILSANTLATVLNNLNGGEDSRSKTIRRYINKFDGTPLEMAAKFKVLINHEDGLLDSVDNEIIQLCHASENREHEHERVQMCIALITAKTTFVKNVLAAE